MTTVGGGFTFERGHVEDVGADAVEEPAEPGAEVLFPAGDHAGRVGEEPAVENIRHEELEGEVNDVEAGQVEHQHQVAHEKPLNVLVHC